MVKQKFEVTGMTCSACSSHVEKSVSKLPGMVQVSVNLLTNSMQVSYDETICSAEAVISAVEKAGYGARVYSGDKTREAGSLEGAESREAVSPKKEGF